MLQLRVIRVVLVVNKPAAGTDTPSLSSGTVHLSI